MTSDLTNSAIFLSFHSNAIETAGTGISAYAILNFIVLLTDDGIYVVENLPYLMGLSPKKVIVEKKAEEITTKDWIVSKVKSSTMILATIGVGAAMTWGGRRINSIEFINWLNQLFYGAVSEGGKKTRAALFSQYTGNTLFAVGEALKATGTVYCINNISKAALTVLDVCPNLIETGTIKTSTTETTTTNDDDNESRITKRKAAIRFRSYVIAGAVLGAGALLVAVGQFLGSSETIKTVNKWF
jgi:hypothetical protein